jgi:preprotein translocase subunit YajC
MEALGSSGGSIVVLILIFAIMYFVMIRPQRKKQKQVEEMRSGVKPGDRITTIGGLQGKIVRVTDDSITIEAGTDKVRLEFMKWAVSKVDEKGAPKSGAAAKVDKSGSAPEEEPAEEETEAPKTVKKPRRLGFKEPEEDDSKEGREADE